MLRVPHDALSNRVDAILLSVQPDEIDGLDCVKMLRREKPDVPVFLIAKTEEIRKAAEETGITGCFVLPDCGRQLLDAIHRVNCKERLL